jgi:3'(2'), 5'-bisphosphate nucleotidase
MAVDYEKFLLLATQAAVEAGKAILSVYHGDINVSLKDDQSPLTKADLDSHEVLNKLLTSSGLPVLSEEAAGVSFEQRCQWSSFWLIDPLDGTKEFIHRNGEFTVNVALIEAGVPKLGVVFAPASDELYAGIEGMGAWYLSNASALNQLRFEDLISLNDFTQIEQPSGHHYTVAVSRSHADEKTSRYLSSLESSKGTIRILEAGSAMKLCLVAAGKADEYPRFGPTYEWDIAAGHAVLLGVNKDVISMEDNLRLRYNKPNLINPAFIAK